MSPEFLPMTFFKCGTGDEVPTAKNILLATLLLFNRCPICRELITIPRGGVSALPPSFLVNQLLDLMARQRREIIPKCSTHQTQVHT